MKNNMFVTPEYVTAQEVKRIRMQLGLTQKELADASHLTQSVIARMESKKAVPQLDTLLKVVDALGCDIEIKAV